MLDKHSRKIQSEFLEVVVYLNDCTEFTLGWITLMFPVNMIVTKILFLAENSAVFNDTCLIYYVLYILTHYVLIYVFTKR